MKQNVLNTDLSGKVAVVTGAGGVLCSYFAKVLARAGAKVALLDLNEEAAAAYAEEITKEGGTAKAYACNVLDKDICYAVAEQVRTDFGPCDILVMFQFRLCAVRHIALLQRIHYFKYAPDTS